MPYQDTGPARAASIRANAHRAVDDPAKLARAANIIRAALDRKRITLAELTPMPRHDDIVATSPLPDYSVATEAV